MEGDGEHSVIYNAENEDPELIESEAVDENEILVNQNKIFNHESEDDEDEDEANDEKPLLGSTSKKNSSPKEKKKIATTKMSALLHDEEIKISKKRWLMLFIFSLNTLMNGVLMVGLSPVTNLVSKHYNQSPTLIEWSTNIFLFLYIWFAIPASYLTNKFGIRKTLILTCCLNVLSTVFHMPGYHSNRFFYYFVGQIPAAISYSFVLQMPSQISACWFPVNERASSTAIGAFMNTFGVALAYLQSTNIVTEQITEVNIEDDVKSLFLFQMVIAVLVAIITIAFFIEKPDNPPSTINKTTFDPNFFESIKILMKDYNFVMLSQTFGVCTGILYTLAVLINPLITAKFPVGHVKMIGWLGFTFLMISYASSSIFAIWIDKFSSYRTISILLNICSFWVWLLFTVFFLETNDFTILFFLFTILGFVGLPYSYLGLEHAVEVTYPIPESTSSVFILMVSNLYTFIFVLAFGEMINSRYLYLTCYSFLFLYGVSSTLAIITKTELKRKKAELKQKLGEF
ncbi:uncharacterized MFS-type transporter C09D4.1-like [Clytia hemisphaerica]|uniref:Uncharacterized protein n=1 Tax=Clytia hemisphaerica TaxID=252671 RepID=A0A7M5XDP2_9CNID